MNIHVLFFFFLPVLARENGFGPQFHKGTERLLFISPSIIDSTCISIRIRLWWEIRRAVSDQRRLQMAVMRPGCLSVCVFQDSKPWSWYLEYLFNQGFDGLERFVQSSISRKLAADDGEDGGLSSEKR